MNEQLSKAFRENLIRISGDLFTKDYLCRHVTLANGESQLLDHALEVYEDKKENLTDLTDFNESTLVTQFLQKILKDILGYRGA